MSILTQTRRSYLITAAKIAASILFLTIGAKAKIPFYPIPITLQTFAVYCIALTLSPKEAFLAMTGYISLGILGVPVFTIATAGISAIMSLPSFGYIVGMLIAAPLMSFIRQKGKNFVIQFIIGYAVVHIFGILWMYQFFDVKYTLTFGVLPFVMVEFLKISVAVGIKKGFFWYRKRKI